MDSIEQIHRTTTSMSIANNDNNVDVEEVKRAEMACNLEPSDLFTECLLYHVFLQLVLMDNPLELVNFFNDIFTMWFGRFSGKNWKIYLLLNNFWNIIPKAYWRPKATVS